MNVDQLETMARLQAQGVESAIVRGDMLTATDAWLRLGEDLAALAKARQLRADRARATEG